MGLSLRPGTPGDARACASICHAAFAAIAGRHAFPPDFTDPEAAEQLTAFLLAHDRIHSVVAEVDGRVVGSNFLWETAAVAGVGPITVDPAAQDGAVGRRLMEAVLARARERRFAGVRLVQAAYHGRSLSLYTNLGFDAREPLLRLRRVRRERAAVARGPVLARRVGVLRGGPGSRVDGPRLRGARGAAPRPARLGTQPR